MVTNGFFKYSLCSLALLTALWLAGCSSGQVEPAVSEAPKSFHTDSLQVVSLLKKGDSLYAMRSGFTTIGESLVYFDSANRLARRLNDTFLMAYSDYFIGNVYNAWNKEPKTTVDYYRRAFALFNSLPNAQVKAYQLRYIIAHALDGEKGNDSLRCVQTIEAALKDLQELPDSLLQKMVFISDFAWVATNIRAYTLAEKVLNTVVLRSRIFNDPTSNNYLDHYYLTRSRIDIRKYGRNNTPYLDSLNMALQSCGNRFDSSYCSLNLSKLYAAVGNYSAAYRYLQLKDNLEQELDNNSVLNALQKELQNRELLVEREKERLTKEELKNKILYLVIVVLALLTTGLLLYLYTLYRRRLQERKEVVRQQQFTNLLLQNVEVERRRIASDLHDGINHDLLNLKNNLYINQPVSTTDVEFIITSVREVSRNLYPALFETVGLAASVQGLCERMQKAGFFTTSQINYIPQLTKEEELQVYRIIQEALNNVAKHAKAEACKITIDTKTNDLWVEIKDNGKGFDKNSVEWDNASFGIQSMHQRAKALKATLSINSNSSGTVITLKKQI